MERFHYSLPTGKVDGDGDPITRKLSLPLFANIPFGIIRKNRKLPEAEQFFALLEALCNEEDLELIDGATQKEISDLMTAWQKESGVTQGESTAS